MPAPPPMPSYARPPVVEVVCGIYFKPIPSFIAPHFGMYWQRIQDAFPECQQVPPLADDGGDTMQEVVFSDVPPLPRMWFFAEGRRALIQLQPDAFLFNWRKQANGDEYPRFETVMAQFRAHVGEFQRFLESAKLGALSPTNCELTYVNHILPSESWEFGRPLSGVLPDFPWTSRPDRFLQPPRSVQATLGFPMPDRKGVLRVVVRTANRPTDSTQLISLEMRARGKAPSTIADAWPWFDLAHEWIVRGFTDITSDAMHKVWGRNA